MERLEAGVVTREFQTVISVFSLRRIEDEERGYRKGGGRARGSSPCRVTRVQRVTNVSDSKLVRSGSFSLAFVVPCKSLVSRNTWNSCVGLRTLSRKPCNHLLLFILQLSPPSIEFLFFPPWKLIFTECVSFIFLYLEKEKLDGYQRCCFFFCWLKMWYNTQYNRFKNSSSSFELDIILYKIIGEELHLFTMDPGWFRDVSQPIFISSKHYDLRNAKLDSCKSSNAHINIQMPRNFMQFRIDRTWCNLLFLFLFTSSVTNPLFSKRISISTNTSNPLNPRQVYFKNLEWSIIKKRIKKRLYILKRSPLSQAKTWHLEWRADLVQSEEKHGNEKRQAASVASISSAIVGRHGPRVPFVHSRFFPSARLLWITFAVFRKSTSQLSRVGRAPPPINRSIRSPLWRDDAFAILEHGNKLE